MSKETVYHQLGLSWWGKTIIIIFSREFGSFSKSAPIFGFFTCRAKINHHKYLAWNLGVTPNLYQVFIFLQAEPRLEPKYCFCTFLKESKKLLKNQFRFIFFRVFVWTTDVFHQAEQAVPLIAIAHLPKIASTATAYILVIILQLVALMLNVMSTNMTKLVLAPKVSLVTLKLNAFACPTLVFPIKDVLVAWFVPMAYAC